MDQDKLIESVMVKAALKAKFDGSPVHLILSRAVVETVCRAALTAIEASGFRVVPVEPTEAMCVAADEVMVPPGVIMTDHEITRANWAAMLAAATPQGEST